MEKSRFHIGGDPDYGGYILVETFTDIGTREISSMATLHRIILLVRFLHKHKYA